MVEYNYIYGFLNNYGTFINGVTPGTEEWRDITINFATELFKVLKNDEHYMLGRLVSQSGNKLEIKT